MHKLLRKVSIHKLQWFEGKTGKLLLKLENSCQNCDDLKSQLIYTHACTFATTIPRSSSTTLPASRIMGNICLLFVSYSVCDISLWWPKGTETPLVHACVYIQLCPTLWTPWTIAHHSTLSMGFSRQEYRSGLPLASCRGSSQSRDWTSISCIGR